MAAITQDKNVLAIVEDEIAFEMAPSDFPEYCEGYISLQDAIAIAGKIPLNVPQLLDRALFDMALKSIENADSKETEQFFDLAKPLLKKR